MGGLLLDVIFFFFEMLKMHSTGNVIFFQTMNQLHFVLTLLEQYLFFSHTCKLSNVELPIGPFTILKMLFNLVVNCSLSTEVQCISA